MKYIILVLSSALFFSCSSVSENDPTLNIVLTKTMNAKAALDKEDYENAKIFLDSALNNIEAVWGEDEAAKKARSLWYAEGSKGFKGEPYERVMAYLYRGLLHINDNELDNARACFRLAYLQDSFKDEEQRDCDFAAVYLLHAWCDYQLGEKERAQGILNQLYKFRPELKSIDISKKRVFLAETGKAPRKLRDGISQNRLVYRRGKKIKEELVALTGFGTFVQELPVTDSVFFQASSRGGRPIDGIIDGKVRFKSNLGTGSNILSSLGSKGMVFAALDSSGDLAVVSGGLAVLGFVGNSISGQVNTKADIRAWKNLPDAIHLTFVNDKEVSQINEVVFLDEKRNKLRTKKDFNKTRNVIWVR